MAVKLSPHRESNYLLVTGTGSLKNAREEIVTTDALLQLIQQHQSERIIIDFRLVEIQANQSDQATLINSYDALLPPETRHIRLGLIVAERSQPLGQFWQMYANNRGYFWKAFTEVAPAVDFVVGD